MPEKNVTVIGLGNSGGKIVEKLTALPQASWINIIAIDTDKEAIARCSVQNKYVADYECRFGSGCGGNVLLGQRSVSRERDNIEKMLHGSSLLVVVGGLGGGTGTGGAPILASVARKLGIKTFFIMTLPFTLEGHSKLRVAEGGIKELLPAVDVLICMPNDLLFASLPADCQINTAFKMADIEVAKAVLSISEIMRCQNLLATDIADFAAVLHQKKSVCSIGVGSASGQDGLNRCHLALEQMLSAPLLGGTSQLSGADAVFIVITGGTDLNLGETKLTLESVAKFIKDDSRVIIGVNTDLSYGDYVQITAVTVKYDHKIQTEAAKPNKTFNGEKSTPTAKTVQDELPLQHVSTGIFLHSTPFVYNGQDLDIPTFLRHQVRIDRGE